MAATSPLTRHPSNPLLIAELAPFPCDLLFNAGVTRFDGRYAMVFRNDYGYLGGSDFTGTNLGLAFSDDGVAWSIEPKPCITRDHAVTLIQPFMPHRDAAKELRRFYDPRLTVIDGRPHLCFAIDTEHGVHGGVAVTDDFRDFEVLHVTAPDNRNLVLFPERTGGRFVRLERPMPVYSRGGDRFDLWCSSSPDLRDWGGARLVLATEAVSFANDKVGPAAPPIRTERGWLTTFHAVRRDRSLGKRGWEDRWQKTYDAGLMLLDLDDPSRVIAQASAPLLTPEAEYETDGFRNDVIFPGGMVLDEDGDVRIYYGAADTVVAMASASLEDLLDFVLAG
ncbi:MAG: glycoside hydrolase family 130 protein [Planctomycetota bacterium]